MKTENYILMQKARTSLTGKWDLAVGAYLVYLLLTGSVPGISHYFPTAGFLSLIIAGPLALGSAVFSLAFSRNAHPKFEQMFQGFNNFGLALSAYLLIVLYVVLWTLLLIIPGIIASLSYSMTFYIIADDSSIGASEAIDKSKKMMDGYKWKLFCLYLRFLGWFVLCVLTLGIGFLWLMPYMSVTMAKFYDDIK